MTGNEYQALAARTISTKLDKDELTVHALCGLASEVGEIHSIFQHYLQHKDREIDIRNLVDEIGDANWFIAELCTVFGIQLDNVMERNIEKLRNRFPEGFDVERSVHRHELEGQ